MLQEFRVSEIRLVCDGYKSADDFTLTYANIFIVPETNSSSLHFNSASLLKGLRAET